MIIETNSDEEIQSKIKSTTHDHSLKMLRKGIQRIKERKLTNGSDALKPIRDEDERGEERDR